MRFAVVILACALAVANAQINRYNNFGFGNGQYQGQYQGQYNQGQYKNQYQPGQYNRFQPYNKYNSYQPIKPFVTSTVRPTPVRAAASVSVTPAPFVTAAPVVPVVPVAPVAPVVAPVPVQVAKVAADSRSAETLKYGNEVNPDGSYSYFFETNNGIAAQAQGTPRNLGGNPPVIPDVAQGSFSWVAPEGNVVSFTYVADENGYQPQSEYIPVPPPVPEQIARALAYIAKYPKN